MRIRAADEGYMEVVKCLLEEGKAEATCEQPKPFSLPSTGGFGFSCRQPAWILRTAQVFRGCMSFCIAQDAEGAFDKFGTSVEDSMG